MTMPKKPATKRVAVKQIGKKVALKFNILTKHRCVGRPNSSQTGLKTGQMIERCIGPWPSDPNLAEKETRVFECIGPDLTPKKETKTFECVDHDLKPKG